jgi:uncharacterized protein
MITVAQIASIEKLVKDKFMYEGTGHDWYHIERVTKLAKYLAEQEGGNVELVTVVALLHDINDHKFNGGDFEAGAQTAARILTTLEFDNDVIELVVPCINEISFKGAGVKDCNTSLSSKIVQDADRLDAIGAIGIARTFAYGGAVKQPLYDPEVPPKKHHTKEAYYNERSHTINHFYEKLLLLKDRLHTDTAKKIAKKRQRFMEGFLAQFYAEWKGMDWK